jgi:hypothetical protein
MPTVPWKNAWRPMFDNHPLLLRVGLHSLGTVWRFDFSKCSLQPSQEITYRFVSHLQFHGKREVFLSDHLDEVGFAFPFLNICTF